MKAPADMTAGEINKALDRLDKARSALTSAFIAAGRGHETYQSLTVKARNDPNDEMAQLAMKHDEQREMYMSEIRMRMGPNHPSRLPAGRFFGPRKFR